MLLNYYSHTFMKGIAFLVGATNERHCEAFESVPFPQINPLVASSKSAKQKMKHVAAHKCNFGLQFISNSLFSASSYPLMENTLDFSHVLRGRFDSCVWNFDRGRFAPIISIVSRVGSQCHPLHK